MATILSLTFMPVQLHAAVTEPVSTTTTSNPAVPAEVQTMLKRLHEIKKTDMSKLTSSEKKNLRKEVKSMNHELKTVGGGVYLSAGALILIVILLIILL